MAYNWGSLDGFNAGDQWASTPLENLPQYYGTTAADRGNVSQAVRDILTRSAQGAGITDFNFGDAAQKASLQASGGGGWLEGANPVDIANAILRNTGNAQLAASVIDPSSAQYAQGKSMGDANESVVQNIHAKNDNSTQFFMQGLGTFLALAGGAGALSGGFGGLGSLGGTGAGTGAAGAGFLDSLPAWGSGTTFGVADGLGSAGALSSLAGTTGGTGAGGMDIWDEIYGGLGGDGGSLTDELFGGWGGGIPNTADYIPGGSSLLPGDALNANAGIGDFVKGAIQSGNWDQLSKLLPNLPSGALNGLKSLFGGSGTGAGGGKSGSLLDLIPGLLGAYGANQQSDKLNDLANRYEGYGAPSRSRFEQSMTTGFDPLSIPGYKGALDSASQAVMSRLSTQGNPFGNPGALIEGNKAIINGTALPAIQNYQNQNAAAGGLSSLAGAAPGIQQQAIGSGGGVLSSLAKSASDYLNPASNDGGLSTLANFMKKYASSNSNAYGLS